MTRWPDDPMRRPVTSGKSTAKDEGEGTGKARSFAKLRMTAQRAARRTRGSIDYGGDGALTTQPPA